MERTHRGLSIVLSPRSDPRKVWFVRRGNTDLIKLYKGEWSLPSINMGPEEALEGGGTAHR